MPKPSIDISVVSHAQGHLVKAVLQDIQTHVKSNVRILLTLNVPEQLPFDVRQFPFEVKTFDNVRPLGFGQNHNNAFRWTNLNSPSPLFCVMNPDIRLSADPFPIFQTEVIKTDIGVAAPVIRNTGGVIENSARLLPTPMRILRKVLFRKSDALYPVGKNHLYPDWIAGMFMLFRSEVFGKIGCFDERYFMYYEDVDLCCRLRLAGYKVLLDPSVSVVHEARRDSHRNFKYMKWHAASMWRFFTSPVFFRSLWRKWKKKDTLQSSQKG